MTEAQKKAEELTGKFYDLFSDELENTIAYSEAQACAKLCVENIIKNNVRLHKLGFITAAECRVLNEENQEVKSSLEPL